eukprot:294523_1
MHNKFILILLLQLVLIAYSQKKCLTDKITGFSDSIDMTLPPIGVHFYMLYDKYVLWDASWTIIDIHKEYDVTYFQLKNKKGTCLYFDQSFVGEQKPSSGVEECVHGWSDDEHDNNQFFWIPCQYPLTSFFVQPSDFRGVDQSYFVSYITLSNNKNVNLKDSHECCVKPLWFMVYENVEILSIDYLVDDAHVEQSVPVALASIICDNRHGSIVAGGVDLVYSEDVSITTFWTNSVGVSISVGMEFEAGVPEVASGKVTTEVTVSEQYTWGEEKQHVQHFGPTFKVPCAQGERILGTAIVIQGEISVPFIMKLRDIQSGKIFNAFGEFNGVRAFDLTLNLTKLNDNNEVVKSWTIPA